MQKIAHTKLPFLLLILAVFTHVYMALNSCSTNTVIFIFTTLQLAVITALLAIYFSMLKEIKQKDRFSNSLVGLVCKYFYKNTDTNSVENIEESFRKTIKCINSLNRDDFDSHLPGSFDGKEDVNSIFFALKSEHEKISILNQKEVHRRWVSESINELNLELRANQHDLKVLCDVVLKILITKLNANQGIVYLQKNENILEAVSTYAYNRKKYINHELTLGEGLVGQCFLEKEPMYLTEVPKDYVKITSGIGESLPRCIYIFPLKNDGGVVGVVELASFTAFNAYEKELCVLFSEIWASVLINISTNENTKKLLAETQRSAELLKKQDVEMRQNMEELISTQEQLEEKNREQEHLVMNMRAQEEELRQNLEELKTIQEDLETQYNIARSLKMEMEAREKVLNLTTIVSEADAYGTILYVNDKFCEVSGFSREELIGKPHNVVRHPDMPKELFRELWGTIKQGKVFRGVVKNRKKNGGCYWVDATISPVIDENGTPIKYIGIRYVIEDEKLALSLFEKFFEPSGNNNYL